MKLSKLKTGMSKVWTPAGDHQKTYRQQFVLYESIVFSAAVVNFLQLHFYEMRKSN